MHDCFKALKQMDTMLRDKLNENVARITRIKKSDLNSRTIGVVLYCYF